MGRGEGSPRRGGGSGRSGGREGPGEEAGTPRALGAAGEMERRAGGGRPARAIGGARRALGRGGRGSPGGLGWGRGGERGAGTWRREGRGSLSGERAPGCLVGVRGVEAARGPGRVLSPESRRGAPLCAHGKAPRAPRRAAGVGFPSAPVLRAVSNPGGHAWVPAPPGFTRCAAGVRVEQGKLPVAATSPWPLQNLTWAGLSLGLRVEGGSGSCPSLASALFSV